MLNKMRAIQQPRHLQATPRRIDRSYAAEELVAE